MAMLAPFPERYRAQMVCRSWHTAAQHQSLFVKVCASDFEPGCPESLAKVLAKVAPGDTVLLVLECTSSRILSKSRNPCDYWQLPTLMWSCKCVPAVLNFAGVLVVV